VKAQKFDAGNNDDDDDGMEEESLLETPLDRVEPYGLFKSTLFSKSSIR
jgi:importin-7